MNLKICFLLILLISVPLSACQPAHGTEEPSEDIGTTASECGDGVCGSIERGVCPEDCDPDYEEESEGDSESSVESKSKDSAGEAEAQDSRGRSDQSSLLSLRNLAAAAVLLLVLFVLATSISFEE